jgi:cysteine desulfurase
VNVSHSDAFDERNGLIMKPIYLDYSATTPVDKRVADKMMHYLTMEGEFGNPASRSHVYGWETEAAVEEARQHVAALIGADPKEIVWTSGATESDNLAIKGVAHFNQKKGKHIITCKTEHKAVLDTCRQLEREGYEVTYLDPEASGLIDLDKLEAAIRPDTTLISIMHVNNEIGVIQDIKAIGEIARKNKVVFHTDAAQSAGKIAIDVNDMNIDLLSLSAHKIYGPKGVGALYVRRRPRVRLEAQMHGGGHERGMRSGTLAVHQIVGMGEAFRIAREEMPTESARILKLRNRLWDGLKDLEEVYVNGDMEHRIPGSLNISFNFVEGESLIMALKDLAVSSGSACTSASLEPSYVLRALGRNDELAHSSIRFSIGRFTTEQDVDRAIELVRTNIGKLRDLSPLWDMYKEGIDLDKVEWVAH